METPEDVLDFHFACEHFHPVTLFCTTTSLTNNPSCHDIAETML